MKINRFTLFELLVVVAIISILVSILLPSLRKVRETAKFAVCRSNLSQHYRILLNAVKDNNNRIPRIDHFGNSDNPAEDLNLMVHDWYGAQKNTFSMVNPTMGLYTSSFATLRCPVLEVGEKGSGVGSNGAFDYSLTGAFSIASISTIDSNSRWGADFSSGMVVPTPIIMEEDPSSGINKDNGEGGFCHSDRLDIRHLTSAGRGAYASIDGSSFSYQDPKVQEFRTFSRFFTALPNGRYDQLRWPTSPGHGIDSNFVWQKRYGIGDQ